MAEHNVVYEREKKEKVIVYERNWLQSQVKANHSSVWALWFLGTLLEQLAVAQNPET